MWLNGEEKCVNEICVWKWLCFCRFNSPPILSGWLNVYIYYGWRMISVGGMGMAECRKMEVCVKCNEWKSINEWGLVVDE